MTNVFLLFAIFLSGTASCDQGSVFESKKFNNKNTEIFANKTFFDKKHSTFSASGNVKILSESENAEKVEASGSFAEYDTNSGKGKLWGENTSIKYFAKGSSTPVVMLAEEVQFCKNSGDMQAYGDVFVATSSGTIRSDSAFFDQKISGAVFERGKISPVAEIIYKGGKHLYEANKMIFYDTTGVKEIFMEGDVKGNIEMEDTINDIKN